MVLRSAALCALILSTACADQGAFPSLARRPVENAGLAPAAPAPVVPADAELAKRIVFAIAKAKDGVEAFDLSLGAAKAAVTRPGGSESEAWIEAQLAVTRLETTLAPAREALSALDGERRGVVSNGNEADLAALETAIATVEAIDSRQSGEVRKLIDALNAR